MSSVGSCHLYFPWRESHKEHKFVINFISITIMDIAELLKVDIPWDINLSKGPFKKYVFGLGGRGSRKIVNRIRMTIKDLITPLYLLFNVAFHVDSKVWVENMNILANMRSKICIKGRLIIGSKFVTIWVVTRGGERGQGKRWQNVTRVRGVKNRW